MNKLPVLGLMLGDVTGIGPEISVKLLASGMPNSVARVVVIGDARVFELGCRDAGIRLAYRPIESVDAIDWNNDEVPLIDLGNVDPALYKRGVSSDDSGRLSGDTLKHMIEMADAGEIDGICFAPLNKGAMNRGGWKYPDEHQMFAALTRHAGFFGEMNVIKEFSTFRVTSHIALKEAVNLISPERITAAVQLANQSLRAAGVAQPRIGVAALNPHCGENGLFGDEEIRIIRPTVDTLRAGGINCSGPISSDVIFVKALKGEKLPLFTDTGFYYYDKSNVDDAKIKAVLYQ